MAQVITSALARVVVVYVVPVADGISAPFFLHWYEGVPPLTGDGVNVTDVPSQTAPEGFAEIVTLAVTGTLL